MLPLAFESLFKLSKILWTGVLIISHQSQSWSTSPACHLRECGLLLLYSEWIYPRIFALHPDKPAKAKSYMHGHSWAGARLWIALSRMHSSILRHRRNYREMPTILWQVDWKLQGGTIFSITPTVCTTKPPLGSGLVRSPPPGYICRGNDSWLRK